MAVSPPFSISETLPLDTDLISIFPGQEHPFRDTVESWLTFLSDPTTGLLKATAFAFPFVIQNTAAGTFFELESQDAGALEGPNLNLYRNSASPAASDVLGILDWYGKDSANNKQLYAQTYATIVSPTSGAESSRLITNVFSAGTLVNRIICDNNGVTLFGVLSYSGVIAGLTGTGALNSGSITSGFGAIDIGTDTLNAGAATFTSMASSGAVSGTTGTFSGAVSGTTGTFSGAVSATGNITANSGGFAAGGGNFAPSSAGTMFFRPNGLGSTTNQMTYTTAGTLTAAGDITAFSDRRLKKSISPLNHLWANDMVREVNPVTYIRKSTDTRGIGFIAQDVQSYAPEIVHEDDHGILSLAYPNMVAILWAVVQDLQAEVAALKEAK